MTSFRFASLDEEEDWLDREVESVELTKLKESAIKKETPKKNVQPLNFQTASTSR